jgi:hypothetical protein
MSVTAPARPDATEYAPDYEKYVSLVPAGDVVETLSRQIEETLALLRPVSEEQAGGAYEAGKWSVKEVVGHLLDAERVFAYRALRFARGDRTPLPGFEQDDYVAGGGFNARTLSDLLDEFAAVRRATVALLRGLDSAAWLRRGTANDSEASVRAIAHIIAGHERHHARVLRERYLS